MKRPLDFDAAAKTAHLTATITERHGYTLLVRVAADPPPGAPMDLPSIPYALSAACHRLAAELWGEAAKLSARWAIDVSYAQVAIELVEGESIHAAAQAAARALTACGIEHGPRRVGLRRAAPRAAKRRRRAG